MGIFGDVWYFDPVAINEHNAMKLYNDEFFK